MTTDDLPGAHRLSIGGEWLRVSPKYVWVELASTALFGAIAIVVSVLLTVNTGWGASFGWLLIAAAVIMTLVLVIIAPRRVRSIGYRLRDDDLLFRRGIMYHRVVAVPYGRMQLIDINRGPIDRALGLAELKFVTAAASTGVTIPGLVEADAETLRDRLVALAETRRAGL